MYKRGTEHLKEVYTGCFITRGTNDIGSEQGTQKRKDEKCLCEYSSCLTSFQSYRHFCVTIVRQLIFIEGVRND